MKNISTLTSNRMNLSYCFDEENNGYKVSWNSANFLLKKVLIQNILDEFFIADEWKPLGAGMTKPMLDGLGLYIKTKSKLLTPRHASAIAAIMVEEGLLLSKGIKPVWLKRI